MRPGALVGMVGPSLRQGPRKESGFGGRVWELVNFRGGWAHRSGVISTEIGTVVCVGETTPRGHENERRRRDTGITTFKA